MSFLLVPSDLIRPIATFLTVTDVLSTKRLSRFFHRHLTWGLWADLFCKHPHSTLLWRLVIISHLAKHNGLNSFVYSHRDHGIAYTDVIHKGLNHEVPIYKPFLYVWMVSGGHGWFTLAARLRDRHMLAYLDQRKLRDPDPTHAIRTCLLRGDTEMAEVVLHLPHQLHSIDKNWHHDLLLDAKDIPTLRTALQWLQRHRIPSHPFASTGVREERITLFREIFMEDAFNCVICNRWTVAFEDGYLCRCGFPLGLKLTYG